VAHVPEPEEFLAVEEHKGEMTKWGWTPVPDFAKPFRRYDKASRSARRYGKGAVVVYMFDVGDQYVVSFVD